MKTNKISDAEFIEYYNKQLTFRELAAHFCISSTTVQKYVKRLNLPKRELIDEIDKERLKELWQKGYSCSMIGREFHMCGTTVMRIARKLGLEERALKNSTKTIVYIVISEPKPASIIPKLTKSVPTEDKPKKSIFIVPTLGEIRKMQLKEEMMRIERENKTFKRNLEND